MDEGKKDSYDRSGSITWAIILISAGAVFLLNNFGYLPWGAWSTLWRFWPIFLIIWGLQAIFGRSRLMNSIISFIAILIVALIFLLVVAGNNSSFDQWLRDRIHWWPDSSWMSSRGELKETQLTYKQSDYQNVTKRTVGFDLGALEAIITDNDSTNFLQLDASYYEQTGQPTVTVKQDGEQLKFDITATKPGSVGWMGISDALRYRLSLGQPTLPTDLNLKLGAGRAELDLAKLKLGQVIMAVGAGRADVKLSSDSLPTDSTAIDVGAGRADIEVPKGTGLKISYDIGVGRATVDGEELKGKSSFQSSNYDTATFKLNLSVKVGVGSVRIVTQ